MPLGKRGIGLCFQPSASRDPGIMECAVVAITDDFRHRLDFAEIGSAKRNVAKSPDKIVMQFIAKKSVQWFPQSAV
jgi:hypothetical protein